MDFCDICLDPPRPLEGRITGAVRLDAVEGNRRLLAELPLREPVRLHFVEVAVRERLWEAAERTVRVVTVYNRSSLPLSEVEVAGGGAVPGSVRLNGLPEPEADPAAGVVCPAWARAARPPSPGRWRTVGSGSPFGCATSTCLQARP